MIKYQRKWVEYYIKGISVNHPQPSNQNIIYPIILLSYVGTLTVVGNPGISYRHDNINLNFLIIKIKYSVQRGEKEENLRHEG